MSVTKNCPETPRQKMIGMMYLVLTAMLALNVSNEVLNGFTMVDNSLHSSIESSEIRNKGLYDDFDYLFKENPTKVKVWLDTAKIVKQRSDELYNYIENFKQEIIKIADKSKADPKSRKIEAKDNLDAAGQYALRQGNGEILKSKINSYSDLLIRLTRNNPEKQRMYQNTFATNSVKSEDTKETKPWENAVFEMMPVSAVVTILTKYQSDIRTAEAETVQYLRSQTDASDFRVNKIQAIVVPNSRMVFRGDKYSAKIVLSAVDSTKTPQYFINGSKISDLGIYEVGASALGLKSYSGEIKMAGNDGIVRSYPFKSDYMVIEPSASISNEDLSVVYQGIDNNIRVAMPGVAPENMRITVEGGTFASRGKGFYVVRPTREGELIVNAYGKVEKTEKKMGSMAFRIKPLPDPKAYLVDRNGKQITEGTRSVDDLKNMRLIASYDENVLIKANFTIQSYSMLAEAVGVQNCTGSKLETGLIDRIKSGRSLIINNVTAIGPDGRLRKLNVIFVKVL
jgi:gliding motility-associated protein GldM